MNKTYIEQLKGLKTKIEDLNKEYFYKENNPEPLNSQQVLEVNQELVCIRNELEKIIQEGSKGNIFLRY